jgi:hypothetical protein
VNLRDLQKAASDYKPDDIAPSLRKHCEDMIAASMGLSTRDARWTMAAKHAAVLIWLTFTLATGVTAFGASVRWWTIDEAAFTRLWTTFVVGFVGVVAEIVRQAWKK